MPDQDLQEHLDALDKRHLKSSGWQTTPLDNAAHDFVTPLLNKYLRDIEERAEAQESLESGFA